MTAQQMPLDGSRISGPSAEPSEIAPVRKWSWAVAGALLYFLVAAYFVQNAEPNADEGFYAYASYNAMHGKMPYRDFAYTQMPALPYLQGPVFALTGYGVRQQRWLNAGLGAVAVLVAVAVWLDAGLAIAACLPLVLAWCLCPSLVHHNTIGKTYAMAQLLLVLAGSVLLSRFSPRRQLVLFSVCAVLAVGCRLTVAPAVGVLWLGFAGAHRRQLSWWILLGFPVGLALLLLSPFFPSWENLLFWNWSYHIQTTIPAARIKVLAHSFTTFPAIGVLGFFGTALVLTKRSALGSPSTWLVAAGLIGWIVSVCSTGVYTDYAIPVLPVLVLGAGAMFAQAGLQRSSLIGGACVVLAAASFGLVGVTQFFAKGYLDSVDETVAYLKQHSRPDDTILAPVPEIPLGAGRQIFPGLDMGKFGLTGEMDEAVAERLKLLTVKRLWQAIDRQEVPYIVLSNFRTWNFYWTIPSLRPVRPAHYQKWVDLLMSRYDCVHISPSFIVFKRHDPANVRLEIDLNPPAADAKLPPF